MGNSIKPLLHSLARANAMLDWARETFGPSAYRSDERVVRFVEEAIELAQAHGIKPETLHKVIERCYERPMGTPYREFSQAAATLETYGALMGWSVDEAVDVEWARVQTLNAEKLRARHKAKELLGIANTDKDGAAL